MESQRTRMQGTCQYWAFQFEVSAGVCVLSVSTSGVAWKWRSSTTCSISLTSWGKNFTIVLYPRTLQSWHSTKNNALISTGMSKACSATALRMQICKNRMIGVTNGSRMGSSTLDYSWYFSRTALTLAAIKQASLVVQILSDSSSLVSSYASGSTFAPESSIFCVLAAKLIIS